MDPGSVTLAQALELIAAKAEKGPSKRPAKKPRAKKAAKKE
jgi:topoisomerase IA-like protein